MSIFIVIAMYGIWSSMFSLAKLALQFSPPLFLTGARMALAGIILLVYIAFTKKSSFRLNLKQWGSMALLAFFSIYLTNAFEFWALQYLTAAKACFIYSLSPFFAAFFSYLHFGERLTSKKVLGLSLGSLGILPVVLSQTGGENLFGGFISWPSLAMVGAALCSVYGWVLLRLIVKDQMISPLMANGSSMMIGGLFAFLHSYFVEPWNPLPVVTSNIAPFLGWTLLMTLVSNIVCYNLYGLMLRKFTATFLSFVGLLSPIFASLHGWLFLGEPLSLLIFLSTAFVCLGLWIVYSTELKQGYIAKAAEAP